MSELSRRYGLALYEVAQEQHLIDQIRVQSQLLADILSESDLQAYFLDVSVEKRQKIQLIQNNLTMFEPILINFLLTVIVNNRFQHFAQIIQDFEAIYREAHHIVIANVTTPIPLSSANQDALIEALSKKYQKQVQLNIQIDPHLISGLRVEIEQDILDNSLFQQLNQLTYHLKKGGTYGATSK